MAAFRGVWSAFVVCVLAMMSAPSAISAEKDVPETVHFAGPDNVPLVGFLFRPERANRRVPAIVLMHGRAGPYSTAAKGVYDATTLSQRHLFWGWYWADRGYLALLVDSFGPRGYPSGFPVHSYEDRPDAVSEVTVRPRDAYAALAYLRSRSDVDGGRIALQGWSNGGSATLATMADVTLKQQGPGPDNGFVGAIAFYPACGLHGAFDAGYKPYAPVRVFSGADDEEVSARRCAALVEKSRADGGDIAIDIYRGATHDFDDPGRKRQSLAANEAARDEAVEQATGFVRWLFRTRKP